MSSIGAASDKTSWSGRIFFSDHGKIARYDLKTGKYEVVHIVQPADQLGYHVWVTLTRVDDKSLLFDRYHWETDSSPEKWDIHRLNLQTGKEEYVRPGRVPTYVPEHHKFLFYEFLRNAGDGKKGLRLFIASLADPIGSAIQIVPDRFISAEPLVQISADEVVYRREQTDKPSSLQVYNLITGMVRPLQIERCYPEIWRSSTQRLLCSHETRESDRHFFTDLEFNQVERNVMPHIQNAIHYIGKFDVGIVNLEDAYRGVAAFHFAIFDFKTKKTTILLKHKGAPRGGAIWFE